MGCVHTAARLFVVLVFFLPVTVVTGMYYLMRAVFAVCDGIHVCDARLAFVGCASSRRATYHLWPLVF